MSPYSLNGPVFGRTGIFEIKYRAKKMGYITTFNRTYSVTSKVKLSCSKKNLVTFSNKRERTLWRML